MAGVAGLRGTGDWGVDERPKSFREKILWLEPNGDSPIFALSGKAGKHDISDPEFSWWCETMNIVRLVTNAAFSTTDTTITVTGADPAAGATFTNPYGNAAHLKPGDILMVEPATLLNFNPELLYVVEVADGTTVIVMRGVGGSTAAAIPSGAGLLLLESAYAEGTSSPRATTRNPVKFTNFTQIFKDSYELTATADVTKARTGDAWSNDKKRKMFDHARAIEFSCLFSSKRNETTGGNGKPIRFTSGVRGFIPTANVKYFNTAVTTDDIMIALKPAWDFSMPGSGDTRIGFIGSAGLLELGRIIKNDDSVMMQLGDTIKMWGMNFRELTMPWGRLLLKSHALLSRSVVFGRSLYVMDFNALKWAPMPGRDTKTHDDVQLKDEDLRRGYVQTEGGWFVDGGGLSMAILDNISST
jgi:hypothetical protein